MVIRRVPLREQVYRALVDRLHGGLLPEGTRLSDTALAGELGVSRTPVREALVRMEREGFLETDQGRGFFVKPLSTGELRQVAPVFWTLQGLAVRLCAPLRTETLDELEALTAEVERSAGDPERDVRLHLRWHQALMDSCENRYLMDQVRTLARVLRRYAHAYWRDTGHVRLSAATHAAVVAALRRGEVDRAVGLLEASWKAGTEEMVRWLANGR